MAKTQKKSSFSPTAAHTSFKDRVLNARPDTTDFRDKMYIPTLVEVGQEIPLDNYRKSKTPVLDQGSEGACTGYALATVANYLLRRRTVSPDAIDVSPSMFYELAKRYDEWPGEDYSGSSARGAMKGWNKHGICSHAVYLADQKNKVEGLSEAKSRDARCRPLGAYFRVNHKDIVAMHSAIAEVGILYATSVVHSGWSKVDKKGVIPYSNESLGGHAFAIVGYNSQGFWIQNSWGASWGYEGYALVTYDDWLENGTDVWVARLGVPITLKTPNAVSQQHAALSGSSKAYSYTDLRPHIISIGNNGKLLPGGDYGTSPAELKNIFTRDFPRIMKDVKKPRLLIFAHGGLVAEEDAVNRVAGYRQALLDEGVYPISFIWHSDYWSTITNILKDSMRNRRPEGFIDDAKDFMLDRVDDTLEPLARFLTGKLSWDEMKSNAIAASDNDGGAYLAFQHIVELKNSYPNLEVHCVGHSAGAIFHSAFLPLLASKVEVETLTLWAPACTTKVFKKAYIPLIESKKIKKFSLFVLNDQTEQDDNCAKVYNKSLLYLVSNAFEEKEKIPLYRDGEPILGMEKFIQKDSKIQRLFTTSNCELILTPNNLTEGDRSASRAKSHGDFDDDPATVKAALVRILNSSVNTVTTLAPALEGKKMEFNISRSSLRRRRMQILSQSDNNYKDY
ncbi:C1 family peptidase [Methylovorus menthalis]|uniref:C1 family peptidase n=1 Tax=Methylovorus menthalis TaxID=1002227 RepID=UPI001E3E9D99|nr:C1 family peptidase [Methylovorus menthalis]MCB4811057.1 C1 family peptidase [Methylovorus menthalis]